MCSLQQVKHIVMESVPAATHAARCLQQYLAATSWGAGSTAVEWVPPSAEFAAGALKEGSLEAGPLGEVARQLNGSNELWLALALAAPGTAELAPPQLAALACGLVAADVRAAAPLLPCRGTGMCTSRAVRSCLLQHRQRPPEADRAGSMLLNSAVFMLTQAVSRPQLRCAYEVSAPVWEAAEALEADREALAELQARHGVDCPLELDLRLAGRQCCPQSAVVPTQQGFVWSCRLDCNHAARPRSSCPGPICRVPSVATFRRTAIVSG
jgi:DSHCT (NUC185) domain